MNKYLDFILFDQFSQGTSEHQLKYDKENHFTKAHPGPITNLDLIEDDKDKINLYGTGKLKKFEPDYIDQYIDINKHQQQHYQIFNEEMWEFLVQRYGGTPIKRFYIRTSAMLYTSVEQKLKSLSVRFLNAQQLQSGNFDKTIYNQYWSQLSKNSNLKDVKKRMQDHLNCAGYAIKDEDVRLWLYTVNDVSRDQDLQKKCMEIKEGFAKGPHQEVEEEDVDGEPCEIECNSGVEFPG